jgi:lipopolysaccharide export system protein LptA
MIHSANFTVTALAVVALLGFTSSSHGLPDDKLQPIHIEADQAVRDEKTGLTLYRGNVKIRQGSLKIAAEVVTLFHIETQADKIVAEGNPARMQQQRDAASAPMHAEGEIIEYYKDEERVHIRHNAKLEQDGSTVRSDSIEYFINQELVKAASEDSINGEDTGRVRMVIPASRLEPEDKE